MGFLFGLLLGANWLFILPFIVPMRRRIYVLICGLILLADGFVVWKFPGTEAYIGVDLQIVLICGIVLALRKKWHGLPR